MCAELVKILIKGNGGPQEETVGNLEDISPSGACIQVEAAMQKGANVEIVCSTCRLKGKVRYCRFVQIGYDVGVQFDKRGSWDRRCFEPEHLLAVQIGAVAETRSRIGR
jgi:hypothetical protein